MLTTTSADLVLLELRASHARELYELLQNNRHHLTAHGDYKEQVSASLAAVEAALVDDSRKGLRFGIFLASKLIGRMDLVPVDPPRYGLGYWLDQHNLGKGHATAALRALVGHAKNTLKASDLYAGVTHGNARSVALLARAGFSSVADFEKYTRYHLPLISKRGQCAVAEILSFEAKLPALISMEVSVAKLRRESLTCATDFCDTTRPLSPSVGPEATPLRTFKSAKAGASISHCD